MPRRRGPLSWIVALGTTIVVLMGTVAWVQYRQSVLVTQQMLVAGDNLAHFLYQADNEYLRLRERWPAPEVQGSSARTDLQALRLRYEIFVSRIGLLHHVGDQLKLSSAREIVAAVRRAEEFIARADEVLGEGKPAPEMSRLQALHAELISLEPALRSLSLGAADLVAHNATRVSDASRAHSRLGIALAIFLSLLALGFAVFAFGQLKRLEARRVELEALTGKLADARRDAEAASQAKSTFLANMSHEIRTPFQGLQGMLQLLAGTELNATQQGYLRTASDSARHLLAVLNDVLDMSRLESGHLALNPAPARLSALIGEIDALMRPQALSKGLDFRVAMGDSLPEAVTVDATRWRQVLFNLVGNAIKFTEKGEVSIEVRADGPAQGAPPRQTLVIEVRDTGIGMDEQTLSRLFKRFSQGDGSRSRRFGGAGLGLEISRSLARLMGGDITASSREGEGSTFTLTLPLVLDVAQEDLQPVGASEAPGSLAAAPTEPRRRLKLLVADDNEVNRLVLDALLANLGHEATFAVDGAEALQRAAERNWDVILMDLHMPVMDGFAASQSIRRLDDPVRAQVPIVAVTADVVTETRERCLAVGITHFLTKPVDTMELQDTLQRLTSPTATAAR
jgi:hypothetical protein